VAIRAGKGPGPGGPGPGGPGGGHEEGGSFQSTSPAGGGGK
jgi:hypothetical protein